METNITDEQLKSSIVSKVEKSLEPYSRNRDEKQHIIVENGIVTISKIPNSWDPISEFTEDVHSLDGTTTIEYSIYFAEKEEKYVLVRDDYNDKPCLLEVFTEVDIDTASVTADVTSEINELISETVKNILQCRLYDSNYFTENGSKRSIEIKNEKWNFNQSLEYSAELRGDSFSKLIQFLNEEKNSEYKEISELNLTSNEYDFTVIFEFVDNPEA
jgi:hypothetical protein